MAEELHQIKTQKTVKGVDLGKCKWQWQKDFHCVYTYCMLVLCTLFLCVQYSKHADLYKFHLSPEYCTITCTVVADCFCPSCDVKPQPIQKQKTVITTPSFGGEWSIKPMRSQFETSDHKAFHHRLVRDYCTVYAASGIYNNEWKNSTGKCFISRIFFTPLWGLHIKARLLYSHKNRAKIASE